MFRWIGGKARKRNLIMTSSTKKQSIQNFPVL